MARERREREREMSDDHPTDRADVRMTPSNLYGTLRPPVNAVMVAMFTVSHTLPASSTAGWKLVSAQTTRQSTCVNFILRVVLFDLCREFREGIQGEFRENSEVLVVVVVVVGNGKEQWNLAVFLVGRARKDGRMGKNACWVAQDWRRISGAFRGSPRGSRNLSTAPSL